MTVASPRSAHCRTSFEAPSSLTSFEPTLDQDDQGPLSHESPDTAKDETAVSKQTDINNEKMLSIGEISGDPVATAALIVGSQSGTRSAVSSQSPLSAVNGALREETAVGVLSDGRGKGGAFELAIGAIGDAFRGLPRGSRKQQFQKQFQKQFQRGRQGEIDHFKMGFNAPPPLVRCCLLSWFGS